MKKNFTIFKSALMLICALLFVQFGIAQSTSIAGLDGTQGSDEWNIGTGTSLNNNASFYIGGGASAISLCGDNAAGKALGLGGVANNGKSVVFTFATTGLQNILLAYDFRRTGAGFNTAAWAYSTDGVNFTVVNTITDTETASSFRSYTIDQVQLKSTTFLSYTSD